MTHRGLLVVLALAALCYGVGQQPGLSPAFALATPFSEPARAEPIAVGEMLTLQLMTELGGMIIFIEIMQQIVLKPGLKSLKEGPHYNLIINVLSFLLAFLGGCAASFGLSTLSSAKVTELFFTAAQSVFVATFGYEVVKNLFSSFKGVRAFVRER